MIKGVPVWRMKIPVMFLQIEPKTFYQEILPRPMINCTDIVYRYGILYLFQATKVVYQYATSGNGLKILWYFLLIKGKVLL